MTFSRNIASIPDRQRPWFISYDRYHIDADITLPTADMSLLDMLEDSFAKFGDQTAYIAGKLSLSFAALERYSRYVASHLQAIGLRSGDVVGVMLPNILQYPIIATAIIRAGMTLVSFNPSYTARELAHQLMDADVKVLFMLDKFSQTFEQLDDTIYQQLVGVVMCRLGDMYGLVHGTLVSWVTGSKVPHTLLPKTKLAPILTHGLRRSDGHATASWNTTAHQSTHPKLWYFNRWLLPSKKQPYQRPTVTRDDSVLIQYTAGTTGTAKGAILTHGNIFANVLQIDVILRSAYKEDGAGDKMLAALPLYHVFSFTLCCMLLIYRGFTGLLVTNPSHMPQLIQVLRQYSPNYILGVTPLFTGLLQQAAFRRLDFSQLKATIGGGMAIPMSIARRWHEVTGLPIIEGYGLSETSPVVAFNPLTIAEFTDKVGIPAPATDIMLIDELDQPVPIGERGEIVIKGPQVMKGYQNAGHDSQDVFTANGYLRSGDIGIMDERGFIKIVDRKKDLMVVSGFNVYPAEIETVMLEHPDIIECAAIGVPSALRGEEPKIFVVTQNPNLTEAALIDYGKAHLIGYKRPRHVAFVASLPKSAVGKVLRKTLRQRERLE